MASVGEVQATLRANVSAFVTGLRAATEALQAMATAGQRAKGELDLVAAKMSEAGRAGAIAGRGAKAWYDGLERAVEQQRVANGELARAEVVGGRAVRGYGRIANSLGALASQALGANSTLVGLSGNIAQAAGVTAVTVAGIAGAVAAIAYAYNRFTEESRRAREEHKLAIQALDEEYRKLTPLEDAQKKLTAALKEQATVRAKIAAIPLTPGGEFATDPALQAARQRERGEAGAVEQRGADVRAQTARGLRDQQQRLALRGQAAALSEAIRLGTANNAVRREAAQLEAALTKISQDGTLALTERNAAMDAAKSLHDALNPKQKERQKTEIDYLLELSRLQPLTAEHLALLRQEYARLEAATSGTARATEEYVAKIARLQAVSQALLPDLERQLTDAKGFGEIIRGDLGDPGELKPFSKLKQQSVEFVRELSSTAKQMRRILADSVTDVVRTLVDGILGGADSIGDALIRTFRAAIANLVAALVAQKVLEPLYKLFDISLSGGGGGGGSLGAAAGTAAGTAIGGPVGGAIGGFVGGFFGREASLGSAPTVNLTMTPAVAPSPAVLARDAQWVALFQETARVVGPRGMSLNLRPVGA